MKEVMVDKDEIIDPTGVVLSPGNAEECQGNGKHEGYECCCDECDYFIDCYPDALSDGGEGGEKK